MIQTDGNIYTMFLIGRINTVKITVLPTAIHTKLPMADFPGGPMVKTPLFQSWSHKRLIYKIHKQLMQLRIKQNNPIKKWTEDLNRHFSKKGIQMAKKPIGHQHHLTIREMQIKTIMRYQVSFHIGQNSHNFLPEFSFTYTGIYFKELAALILKAAKSKICRVG